MVARPNLAPLASLALIVLALATAPAAASPRTDPTAGRAVFTGATLPNASSIGLNPAALGLREFGEVLVALTGTLDHIRIDPQELDAATGTLSPGPSVRAVELSPGALVGIVFRTGRYTLGVQGMSPPSEQFVSGQDALRYHTTGGYQREYTATLAGSIRASSKFYVGAAITHANTFLRLRYTRDAALADGGPPGGPEADEAYDVDVRSPYVSGSNVKVGIGLAAQVYRDVWVGIAYHTPPGFAIQTELEGNVGIDLARRAGGGSIRGGSTVYVQYPASVDAEVRARITDELDLHVGGRWEDLSRMQAYDVRAHHSAFSSYGIPEWTLRTRGFQDSFALWTGVERVENGQTWRYGGRIGYETASVDKNVTSPMAISPASITLDAGGQLRIARSSWSVQLSYGVQLFRRSTVTDSAFDPRFQIACVESGYDYESAGCEASREGYAIATAAGAYGRFQHALRLALRYDLP